MYNPFPLDYQTINLYAGHYNPSPVKAFNNDAFCYWERALFQRACSVIKFTSLPDTWKGSVEDFLYWCLFRTGRVCVLKDVNYGYIFQPCGLKGRNIYYQPTEAIIANPNLEDLSGKELIIGQDTELIKLTPDYSGIWDIIAYYAEELANLKSDTDMAEINAKIAWVLGAKNRAAGESLKKIFDEIQKGQPGVVFDKRIANDNTDKDIPFQFLEFPFDKAVNSISELLMDIQTTLNNFDTEIGIPTIPYQKKERMVTSEAESKVVDSTSRSVVWLKTLKNSIAEVNKLFPEQTSISVELRFDPDDKLNEKQENDEI